MTGHDFRHSGARDDVLGPRLCEGADEVAHLLARVPAPRPLAAHQDARIRAVLGNPRQARTDSRRRRGALVRWWVLATVCVGGVAAGGPVAYRAVFRPSVQALPPEAPARLPAPAARRPSVVPIEAPGAGEGDPAGEVADVNSDNFAAEPERDTAEDAVAPAEAVRSAPRARTRPRGAARPRSQAEAAPGIESRLGDESRLLAGVLEALRTRGDARDALRRLDAYEAQYPDGELAHEAERTRVEALLALGKQPPALALLDGMTFGRGSRDVELLLARAELRARRGRLAEAEQDFTRVLHHAKTGARAERALYGRASSRLQAGAQTRAEADMRAYLERFPDGRHADRVRAALQGR